MANGGLVINNGIEFQKEVFLYFIYNYFNTCNEFIYEGDDDIELKSNKTGLTLYVQAKNGLLDRSIKLNILYNWLAVDNWKYSMFILFSGTKNNFNIDDLIIEIKKEIKTGLNANKTSNLHKAFNNLFPDGNYDEEKIDCRLDYIKKNYSSVVLTFQHINQEIKNIYRKEFLKDEVLMDSQIDKRINYVKNYVLNKIHSVCGVSKINPVIFEWSELGERLSEAKEIFKLDKYNERRSSFKTSLSNVIDESKREVIQMRKADLDNSEIFDNLINEIFYNDFKQYYLVANYSDDIDSLEDKAYYNYNNSKRRLKIEKTLSPENLYFNVMNSRIDDDLIRRMNDAQFCTVGCYISLTSNETPDYKKISWSDENE